MTISLLDCCLEGTLAKLLHLELRKPIFICLNLGSSTQTCDDVSEQSWIEQTESYLSKQHLLRFLEWRTKLGVLGVPPIHALCFGLRVLVDGRFDKPGSGFLQKQQFTFRTHPRAAEW